MASGHVTRDSSNKMIGGVCSGLAEHFGWSVRGTRIVYVIVSLVSAAFPGILVYLLLWLLIPASKR